MIAERAMRAAVLLALWTPLLMIGSRGIAPLVLAAVAALLAGATMGAGRWGAVMQRLRAGASGVTGTLAVALISLLAASLAWTPALERGGEHVAHLAGTLALLSVALASIAVLAPRLSPATMAAAVASAAALATIDLGLDGRLRGALGFSTDLFRLNRTAVALALMLPLATALLARARRLSWMAIVWLMSLAAIFGSQSASAQLGVLVVGLTLALCSAAPVVAHRLVAAVAVGATLSAPVVAPLMNDIVPGALHAALGYGTLTIRGEIWQEYAALIGERPLLGHGVEASHVVAGLPAATALSAAQRALLDWGHPHNAALQVWFELGLVGALLAAGLLAALFRAIARHSGALLPAATATAAGAYAVAFVSHGAWQAWWWCLLALIAVLFAAAPRQASSTRDPGRGKDKGAP